MSRRTRRVVALVALCVAASMALGVGSYSSVSADRSVSVSVVGDKSAYLGVRGGTLHCGDNAVFHNQFSEPVTGGYVGVTPVGDDLVVRHDGDFVEAHEGEETTIPIGENVSPGKPFKIQLKPINNSADSVTLDIEVNGSGFSVSTTQSRYVDCQKQSSAQSTDWGTGPPEDRRGGPKGDDDGDED